ncbi:Phosphoglycolate phosphatase-like protein, partial [Dinothrombium tinctorium]
NKNVAAEVIGAVDYIICDIDGVLRLNNVLIPGTSETIKKLRNKGKRIVFATNNTATRNEILVQLNELGFDSNIYEIMTSSFAAALYFKKLNLPGKTYIMGENSIFEEFKNLGVATFGAGWKKPADLQDIIDSVVDEEVNAVIIGYDFYANYAKFVTACTYAKKCNNLWATNCDKTFAPPKTGSFPVVVPGTGAFVSFVETATELKAKFLGKPTTFFFECLKLLEPNLDQNRTLMIGDSLKTDIAFGNQNSFRYTCLVETGTDCCDDILNTNDPILVPSHYIRRLSDLNKYL